jgi:pimeloyl-ACP methyl ester carboxylesterase
LKNDFRRGAYSMKITTTLDQQNDTFDRDGPADAPAILLVHGSVVTRKMWLPQLRGLSDTYQVIAPDLPGHGALAHVPFTFASAVDSLADIIVKEARGRALVAGLSLGGYVTMELARRSPDLVAGLVLSGCSFNFDGLLGHYLKFASWLMRRGWLKLSTEQSKMRVKRMFPPALSDVAEAQLQAGVFPDALGPSYAEMAGKDFSAVLRQFPGPVLILNGERDASSRRGESKFLSAARQGRGQNIPDAGHACNLDQPEKYNLAVREFARSIGWLPSQAS